MRTLTVLQKALILIEELSQRLYVTRLNPYLTKIKMQILCYWKYLFKLKIARKITQYKYILYFLIAKQRQNEHFNHNKKQTIVFF
jgi:hypothetical protein